MSPPDSAASETPPSNLLGVVLAGGMGRRFGGDKALFPMGGKPMAGWALHALAPWTVRQVVVSNNPRVPEALGVPGRGDLVPGNGPLGGLHTALEWARDDGIPGVFVLACDLPLVPSDLVGRILSHWPPTASAVVPGSSGPLGLEPLCAGYALQVLPFLKAQLQSGDLSLAGALSGMGVHRVPPSQLGPLPELGRMFTNVNTPEDARRAGNFLRDRLVQTDVPSGGS